MVRSGIVLRWRNVAPDGAWSGNVSKWPSASTYWVPLTTGELVDHTKTPPMAGCVNFGGG